MYWISAIYNKINQNKDDEDEDLYKKIVIFDSEHRHRPQIHFLKGKLSRFISHKIRYDYKATTGCPYEDTRVISWKTFIKRERMGYKKMPFRNLPNFYIES